MDELELSGRRHISTKRAGKEHGYHSDYIGQLIRGKKVAGQKVGRSWYVDEESLRVYLGKNPAPADMAEAPVVQPIVVELPVEEVAETIPEIVEQPAAMVAEEKVEIKKEIQEQPHIEVKEVEEVEHTIAISKPKPAQVVAPTGGLTYLSDDEPLLPTVRTRARDEHAFVAAQQPAEVEYAVPAAPRRSMIARAALLAVLALGVAGLSAGACVFVAATTTIGDANTASLHYSIWGQ